MPSRDSIFYFGAGPAPLPTPVLEDAAPALLSYQSMGIGVAEMSHRSPEATKILLDAKSAMIELLDIPSDYEILFLQGGGSGEFSAVVYHMVGHWVERERVRMEKHWHEKGSRMAFASEKEKLEVFKKFVEKNLKLEYLVTGSWSLKASQEAARLVGAEYVSVVTDAREQNGGKFGVIPEASTWNLHRTAEGSHIHDEQTHSALTYYCDNETVDGVEFPSFPSSLLSSASSSDTNDGPHIICDMSSNFLSRCIPISKYSIIFSGAQKNLGIPGITIVIIRKTLLGPTASPTLLRHLHLPVGPIIFDFATIAKNNSLYNTLPIFDVWIALQVLRRLLETHGAAKIGGQEALADQKAELIYGVLEKYADVYGVVPAKEVRSRMNICLRVGGGDQEREKLFLVGAEGRGLLGLKGHRSVGGIRISNYNAVPLEAVAKLVRYLQDFASAK